jgi:transposase
MTTDGRTLAHETLETIRLMAVRRVREGEAPSEVIKSYGFCRTTIYRWLRQARRGGEPALRARKATGRPPRLSGRQQAAVARWITGKDPRQYGFDFALWTRQVVAELIAQRFGVRVSRTAVGRLLAALEITPQKPLRRAYERDPLAIERCRPGDDALLRLVREPDPGDAPTPGGRRYSSSGRAASRSGPPRSSSASTSPRSLTFYTGGWPDCPPSACWDS